MEPKVFFQVPKIVLKNINLVDHIAKDNFIHDYQIQDLSLKIPSSISCSYVFTHLESSTADIEFIRNVRNSKYPCIFLCKDSATISKAIGISIINTGQKYSKQVIEHIYKTSNKDKKTVIRGYRFCRKNLDKTQEYCLDNNMEKTRLDTIKGFCKKKESYSLVKNIDKFCYWSSILMQDIIIIKMFNGQQNIANFDFKQDIEKIASNVCIQNTINNYKSCVSFGIKTEAESKINPCLFVTSVLSFVNANIKKSSI